MSESQTTEQAEQQPQEGAEAKTFDADYVEKLRKENAKHRTEAKANADAARRLAEIEEGQKSVEQKAADRIAKAEAEVASIPARVADALRGHLVALHGISDEDAELFLTATEPELLLKQAARLTANNKTKRHPDPTQGKGGTPPADDKDVLARQFFGIK